MLDLLLIPAVLLAGLALRAARRGDHRAHGHLMTAAFTLAGLRMVLRPRAASDGQVAVSLGLLALVGGTVLLGRRALAWREGRSTAASAPRTHRASGATTLAAAALVLAAWLLRTRG